LLKHLTLEEMVALLAPWLPEGRRYKQFMSIAEIAPLHAQVVSAHQAVLAVRPVDTAMSPAMRRLLVKGAKIDNRHDQMARVTALTLQAESARCLGAEPPDEERAASCDAVQKKLLPDGLSVINTSFLAESGNVARIAKLMEDEPEIGQLLKTLVTPDKKPLLATVEAWIATGPELAAFEHEKQELESKQAKPADKATIQAARAQWFRVVSTILGNVAISLAKSTDIEAIRGPVLRASERAGKRYASETPDTAVLDPEDADTGAEGAGADAGAAAVKKASSKQAGAPPKTP